VQSQPDFKSLKIRKKKTVLTAKPETKTMPKLTFRDNQTFAEVLSVAKPSKKMVVYESIYDDKE
jgi:hypothetical protein